MKHGEITRPGDEFNHDDMAFCEKCGSSHTTAYKGCDGLRGPPPTPEGIRQWRAARGADKPGTVNYIEPEKLGRIEMIEPTSALGTQVGGDHYKTMKIQPLEYCHANGIGKIEGDVIAYVSRWRAKGGVEDLRKAVHELQILIELEEKARV